MSNEKIIYPALGLLFLFIIKNSAGHWIFRSQAHFINNVATRISKENLVAYLYGNYANYADKDSSVYVRKIIHTPTEFAQYVLLNFQQIVTEFALVFLSIIALLIFKTNLFVILIITLTPAILLMTYLMRKRLNDIKKHIKNIVEKFFQYLHESLNGFVESNIYDSNQYFIRRHYNTQKELNRYISDMQIVQDIPTRLLEVFAIIGLFILLVITKMNDVENGSNFLIINAFMAGAYKIIPGAAKIVNLNNQLRTYLFTLEEITPSSITSLPVSADIFEAIYSIRIRKINFSHKDTRVFLNFNASFSRGTLTGIYGSSGRGKTTLLHLLLQFYQSDTGEIYINDQLLTFKNKQLFWRKVSYIRQTSFLLHASILNNIVMFEKKYDKERLKQAVKTSGVGELFPEGLEKMIMENGKNISGGQKQRIVFARALYKNSEVFLFDEPFSELDISSEMRMMKELKLLAESGKIIVLISHNKESFNYCHSVIDLDIISVQGTNA
ncbi:ATP-binding cassette domain-containing protein [Arachidicoccus sp.]|uniref:ATP-binding cassette domain-containing protein n=1 Tax=Arachidicoccus sp. TaxID=1872624 RepID=UPI003D25AC3A